MALDAARYSEHDRNAVDSIQEFGVSVGLEHDRIDQRLQPRRRLEAQFRSGTPPISRTAARLFLQPPLNIAVHLWSGLGAQTAQSRSSSLGERAVFRDAIVKGEIDLAP
jgi:hypothetical protein